MNLVPFFISVAIVFSCSETNNEEQLEEKNIQEQKGSGLNVEKDWFTRKNLGNHFQYQKAIKEFTTDSIRNFYHNVIAKEKAAKPIIGRFHLEVFQEENPDTFIDEGTYYLYNLQSQSPLRFSVIGMDTNWVQEILLMTYNSEGKLVQKNILAQAGGDQDRFVESKSTFIDDSTFIWKQVISTFDIKINGNLPIDSTISKISLSSKQ